MTHKERVIVSAYTGYLMCDMPSVHEYIKKVLGRPVWTHELADSKVTAEIKEKCKPDFLSLCSNEKE